MNEAKSAWNAGSACMSVAARVGFRAVELDRKLDDSLELLDDLQPGQDVGLTVTPRLSECPSATCRRRQRGRCRVLPGQLKAQSVEPVV